jgi:hypothetical protein
LDPSNEKWKRAIASPTPASAEKSAYYNLVSWLEEEDLWRGKIVRPTASSRESVEVAWRDAGTHRYQHTLGRDLDPGTYSPDTGAQDPTILSSIQGTVKMEIDVDDKGRVRKVTPLSGDAANISGAESDVSTWKFLPWKINGVAVAFHTFANIHCNVVPFFSGPPPPRK